MDEELDHLFQVVSISWPDEASDAAHGSGSHPPTGDPVEEVSQASRGLARVEQPGPAEPSCGCILHRQGGDVGDRENV
jgi:hypothetical protein